MEFRLLGQIEARADGRGVELGHARQQCVLAVLLVEANRPVTVDQLIDRVWAHRPPQRSREALYSYLSRLRRVLAVDPQVRIQRGSDGYLLRVDPASVDLHRFRSLVATAGTAADDRQALALLDEALRLWHGDPLPTLDTPWLSELRDGLRQERLAADLDRHDAALRLGRHADVVGPLTALTVAHPLNERVAGQLMLALYRSGRQADALTLFDNMRHRLVDELGVDPDPTLRRLHQQILRAEPTLDPSPREPREGGGTTPPPAQLPHSLGQFVGRDAALAKLDSVLTNQLTGDAVGIIAIAGTAGVGKTTLALRWAHRIRERFPDGQLYANLRGFDPAGQPVAPDEAIRGFLDAFDVPPQQIAPTVAAQAAQYRSLLAGRRVLLVLDDARDAAHVRPLLPGTPGCLVVVTSRDQLTALVAVDGAHPLRLDLLPPEEARLLLIRRLGADRVAAEPGAVNEIIAASARLPLALSVMAARAATGPHHPLSALATQLHAVRRTLDMLDGGDEATNVRTVFSWSYQRLSAPAARLFRLLGLHPGPHLSTAAATSLAGRPAAEIRPLLVELARAHLVDEPAPGRFSCHDLLRAYAAELVETSNDGPPAQRRMLDHYLHTAHAAHRALNPHRDDEITLATPVSGVDLGHPGDPTAGLTWFDTERATLSAVLHWAAERGFDRHVWQLAWTLTHYLHRRALWHESAVIQQAALTAADHAGDRRGLAVSHAGLAYACIRLGRYDEADAQLLHALHRYKELDDDIGTAHAHRSMTWLLDRQGRYREALPHAQQALDLFTAAGHLNGQARAWNALGWFHTQLGDHEQALVHCHRALELQRKIGARFNQADTIDSLANAYHQLGRYEEAIASYTEAIALYREFGDRYNEGDTLVELGTAYLAAGDPAAARRNWQQALTVLDALDHPDAANVRTRLAALDAS